MLCLPNHAHEYFESLRLIGCQAKKSREDVVSEIEATSPAMAEKARISVLCSGNGSNLQALIDNCQNGVIPAQIIKVTVDKKDAYAVKRAEAAGIPTDYFNKVNQKFVTAGEKDAEKVREGRSKYDAALAERLLKDKPELIVLAGWMHVFSASFLRPVAAAGVGVINLHPGENAESFSTLYSLFQGHKLSLECFCSTETFPPIPDNLPRLLEKKKWLTPSVG